MHCSNVNSSKSMAASVFVLIGFHFDSRHDNSDVVLHLTDKRGKPTTGRLSIRILQQSMSAVAAALEHAQLSAHQLSQPLAIDAGTDVVNAVSNQWGLITSFESLLTKVGLLVKIGDEIAKVCPCRILEMTAPF
jgi:hypothetical protein